MGQLSLAMKKTSKTDDQVGDEEAVLLSEILQDHTTLCVLNLCSESERKEKDEEKKEE